jgi:serine protease Do
VVGAEPALDLAILKLDAGEESLPYFDLSQSATVGAGTRVLAFGNMFGIAGGDEPVSVVQGVVSAFTVLSARRGSFSTSYEGAVYIVDAITNNPGAGGGVLTTVDGRLLGMIGKELRNARSSTWVNYAIPAADLNPVAQQIMTGQFASRTPSEQQPENPRRFAPLDFGLVLVPDVVARTPCYVDSVLTGSAADQAGLRADDLILFANGELIQSCREFRDRLGRLETGDRLQLLVRRGAEMIEVQLSAHKKQKEGAAKP